MNDIILIGWPLHLVKMRKHRMPGDLIIKRIAYKNGDEVDLWSASYLVTEDKIDDCLVAIVDHETVSKRKKEGTILYC